MTKLSKKFNILGGDFNNFISMQIIFSFKLGEGNNQIRYIQKLQYKNQFQDFVLLSSKTFIYAQTLIKNETFLYAQTLIKNEKKKRKKNMLKQK